MLIEAVDHPICYRFSGGEIRLEPGQPVEVEPGRAAKLLARAGAKVRAVEAPSCDVVLESASPTARPVFWERGDGSIVGPAQPELLARVGSGPKARFWVIAICKGSPVWINSAVLRSKQQFETQARLKPVEWIREPR